MLAALTMAPPGTIGTASAQVNVLTANYDNGRTNANLNETALNPKTVTSASFGKIGTFPVDGIIYAQPLYASGVQIAGRGRRNVVYVATMHNSVYAIDADAPQTTSPLWTVNLGASIPSAVFNFSDILPEVGILSTPVIDPSRGVIYVVANTLESGVPVFRLHALSLADGSEQMNGPVLIEAAVAGTAPGSSEDGVVSFDPYLHLQRPGLALANNAVYVAFGSHADLGNWHGWLISYDASDLQHKIGVLNTSPNGVGGSIWQAGRGPVVDNDGDIYVVTGNGDFDGESAFGESVLRLTSSAGPDALSRPAPAAGQRTLHSAAGRAVVNANLSISDWFTPENFGQLNDSDWDFGSTGAILVPQTKLLLAGSKAGILYLIPCDSMGHVGSTGAQAVQVNRWGMFDMALWANARGPIVYLAEPRGAVKAFQIVNGQINPTMLSKFPISSFFVGLAVSANGGADGSGLVWLTTGDSNASGQPGTLHALDAADLSKELWNSGLNAVRDGMGRFAKFVAPTVANGRVYVPTFSNALVIYGLLSGNAPSIAPPQITSVVSGASFLGDAVSPGEVVAIFGTNLGASALTGQQTDAKGRVSTSLAGTQVLFDGIAAPLTYASSTQVGAVAPFEISGSSTKVQVVYQGQTSDPLTVPVVSAAPSLFSMDGNGGGPGVNNQDGTENTWYNPAAPGSVVTFYATGGGRTIPASVDGVLTSGPPYPVPLLPVAVLIDGQEAAVQYAGAAPGKVAGILQVKARIPDTLLGYNMQVVLKVGDYTSPNTLSISLQ